MSGLHEAFDQIVADVPVYGDLDRAIEQADGDQRRRYGVLAGLAAVVVLLVVIAGFVAVSRDAQTAPPIAPVPTPTKSPSQSPQTWEDAPVSATHDAFDWEVPNPLTPVRDAWFAILDEHLAPTREHLEHVSLSPWEAGFEQPGDISEHAFGRIGLMADRGAGSLFGDGCRYLGTPVPSNGTPSCSTERFDGPGGETARISRYGRRCGAYEGGPAPATCGDYKVAVAVARRDGRIGYVVVEGRGTPDFNPFTPAAMAGAAADPRLTLPATAFAVPADQTVASVVQLHLPGFRIDDQVLPTTDHPGFAEASGSLGRVGLWVSVWPAGGTPACGRRYLVECLERRVFGDDDPTTVFVGSWDVQDSVLRPKGSRASHRQLVYVGPAHTVVVTASLKVRADEESLGAGLDRRVIDLLLDPRLQQATDRS